MGEKDDKKSNNSSGDSDDGLMGDGLAGAQDMMNLDNYFPPAEDEMYRSLDSVEGEAVLQQCCCCICNCQTKATEGITCCCVIPIKCGITTIGLFAVVLAAVSISAQFFLMLNDNVKWWYCLVNLILLIPTYIAASFFVVWFGKDNVSNRGSLACSCIMIIVSAALQACWAIIYFVWIYKGDTVYYGWGTTEEGYVKYQKRYYLFRELAWAIIVIALFSYFICICNRYAKCLRSPRDEENQKAYKKQKDREAEAEKALDEEAKNKDKPKKAKKADTKKDDTKSEAADAEK